MASDSIHALSASAAFVYAWMVSSWNGRRCLFVWVRSQSLNSLIIICRISRGVYAVRNRAADTTGAAAPITGTGSPATRNGSLRTARGAATARDEAAGFLLQGMG